MSTADLIYVAGALLATVLIPSLPMLASLRVAGPWYRAAALKFLGAGLGIVAAAGGWMVLGWFSLAAGPHWWKPYCVVTLVLMAAWFVLLPVGIWLGNRALGAAQRADRETVAGTASTR